VLYSNICISPPRTDRPATASLTPYETAAFEVLVGEEPELEVVLPLLLPELPPVPPVRVVGLSVDMQVNVPSITLLAPASALKPEQSSWLVLSTWKPPTTLFRAGSLGLYI
jgi:hypothetical protein